MTYLEAVNAVLLRLREDSVTSVTEDDYTKIIGAYVNDALTIVENSYDWGALRTTYTITTEADTFSYTLTGAGQDITHLRFLNDTSNWFMEYKSQAWFDDKYLNNTPESGSPRYWTYNGVDSSGDTQLDVYPKPNGVYTLRFNAVSRQGSLSDGADEILVPSAPVVHLAVAMAARERGETGGTSVQEYFQLADRFLSDAISYEAAKHQEEIDWS